MREEKLKIVRGAVFLLVALFFGAVILGGCTGDSGRSDRAETYKGEPAKYVFLFIGDGMGMPQINAAEIFLGATAKKEYPHLEKLGFTQFPSQGMMTTYAADSFITDSASAITAMAAGHKTNDGVINMDPGKKVKYKSVAEMARDKGMKVGIVSSVSIDHATPAGFYAHQPSRNNYYAIAQELVASNFDFFGGGGFKQPQGSDGKQQDVLALARSKGYKVINKAEEIKALKPGDGKVIAINPVLDKEKALTYAINALRGQDPGLSLAEYTAKAIEMLDNPKGFFLMVEGGKIDWACHANDAATAIHDTLDFDRAVAEAVEFSKKHPKETLIVVTGDHECGGMTLGFAGTKYETYFDLLAHQKISYDEFDLLVERYRREHTAENAKIEDWLPALKENFGLEGLSGKDREELVNKAKAGDREAASRLRLVLAPEEVEDLKKALALSMLEKKERPQDARTYLLYGGYEPLTVTVTHILNQKVGIGWTSYSHTGVPIPVYAVGAGAEMFSGYYDNTDLYKKMCLALGFDPARENVLAFLPGKAKMLAA
ncbi:MAG: alkaline phosphatase [Armatimonadetes bacterium]|nr:alkaline phosphatase [Armatimonadota bacterium]